MRDEFWLNIGRIMLLYTRVCSMLSNSLRVGLFALRINSRAFQSLLFDKSESSHVRYPEEYAALVGTHI